MYLQGQDNNRQSLLKQGSVLGSEEPSCLGLQKFAVTAKGEVDEYHASS